MTTNHAASKPSARHARILSRRDVDREIARAANALDVEAEAVLRSDPGLSVVVDRALEALASNATTRGIPQRALRRIAQQRAKANPTAERARQLHAQADALYWRMVLGWSSLIHRHAIFWAPRWGLEQEEVCARLRVSWYEAALRFDPDGGSAYDRYATRGEQARHPEAGPPDPLIHVGRSNVGKVPYQLIYLDGLDRSEDDDDQLGVELVDDADPLDEAAERRQLQDRALAYLDRLTIRERFAITERYLSPDGQTLDEVGRRMRLSRERVRQIEQAGLAALRAGLADCGVGS